MAKINDSQLHDLTELVELVLNSKQNVGNTMLDAARRVQNVIFQVKQGQADSRLEMVTMRDGTETILVRYTNSSEHVGFFPASQEIALRLWVTMHNNSL